MAYDENPPFGRGETYPAESSTDGDGWVGKEYTFPDLSYNTNGNPIRTGRMNRCRIVRNASGGTMAACAKKVCLMKNDGTAAQMVGTVMGLSTTAGEHGWPIDEFLPAAGVPANYLFYVVVDGVATCITDSAGDTNISIGHYVVVGTGTDGNVVGLATAEDDADIFTQIHGTVGRALEAVNATATDILIEVVHR